MSTIEDESHYSTSLECEKSEQVTTGARGKPQPPTDATATQHDTVELCGVGEFVLWEGGEGGREMKDPTGRRKYYGHEQSVATQPQKKGKRKQKKFYFQTRMFLNC